jgi:hypothetical protein
MRMTRKPFSSGFFVVRHQGFKYAPPVLRRYVRPLLMLTSEILAYLERRGLSYRHDSSNDETVFLRNRIRHECLPYLRTFNPAISERLNNAAEILAADETVLETLIDQLFPRISESDSEGVVLDLKAVRAELPGVRFRLYRRALLILRGDLARIATIHLNRLTSSLLFRAKGAITRVASRRVAMICFIFCHGKREERAWEIGLAARRYVLPDGRISVASTAGNRDLYFLPRFFDLPRPVPRRYGLRPETVSIPLA